MYLGYARNVECENCRNLQTLHIICVQRSFDRVQKSNSSRSGDDDAVTFYNNELTKIKELPGK